MDSWGAPGAWEASGRAAQAAGQPFEWEPREWDDTSWRALRGGVYRRDAEAVVEALRQRDLLELAHLAGDGILLALEEGVGEAVSYALVLIRRLSERQGPGDAALADELRAATGHVDVTPKEPFPIDLNELAAELYDGDSLSGWRIDRETARWWPDDPEDAIGEPPPPHWDDKDRWIFMGSLAPQAQQEDMADFISTVDDPRLAEGLRVALDGRGGFRRFRSVVTRDEEVGRRWQRFEDERHRARAREWLADRGYRPAPSTGARPG